MRYGGFLRKRAEDDIQKKMEEHIGRIQLAAKALISAVKAWRKGDFAGLDREVGIISAEENTAFLCRRQSGWPTLGP